LIAHSLSQLAALLSSRTVCVSEELRSRLLWGRSKSFVIPTGVDTSVFYPRDRASARRLLGWHPDDPVAVFNAGGRPVEKRLDLAKAAMKVARVEMPNARLHVLDGSTPADRVPLVFAAADCLILTSDFEGSPTVVQEAAASNLPVVTVPVGDVQKILSGVSPSYIVERNATSLGRAVADVLANPVRSNGYEVARNSFSLEVVSREFLKILG
jgi:glycosyltransferase involved in cell wall biosynthesis